MTKRFLSPRIELGTARSVGQCLTHSTTGAPPLPYFFGYKTEFVSFQNNPKNLDPSYKMDLDLWNCSGKVKLV